MSFLPADYEAPQGGNYMRLQTGDNRIRILGSAVVGNEFWTTDADGNRRPVRRRMHETIDADELGTDQHGKRERPKHFWAFPVWNVSGKQVQILEITQRSIQDGIMSLNESDDWGDPTGYDIVIRKSGSGLDTTYSIMPGKASPIAADAAKELKRLNIDMDALFDGGDPFASAGAAGNDDAADEAPQGDEPTSPTYATISGVDKQERGGKTVWFIKTDCGEFGTLSKDAADEAERLCVGQFMAELAWEPTKQGGRLLTAVTQAEHQAVDAESIPF